MGKILELLIILSPGRQKTFKNTNLMFLFSA